MNAGTQKAVPYFSIIIPVYNRAAALEHCLRSIAAQVESPSVEIIVIDDGSEPACTIERVIDIQLPIRLIRQDHFGIPTARNSGMRVARAPNVLFVDSDCALEPRCLHNLQAAMSGLTADNAFQLRIEGTSSSITGLAEHCRLSSLQARKLTTDGHIRWLDTAGFAIRRSSYVHPGLFDTRAARGSDSVLLAQLMDDNRLPVYVSAACVQHCVNLSVAGYLFKAFRSCIAESGARQIIHGIGRPVTSPLRARLRVIPEIFDHAPKHLRFVVVSVVLVRYALQVAGRLLSRIAATLHESPR